MNENKLRQEKERGLVEQVQAGKDKAEDEVVKYIMPTVFLNVARRLSSNKSDITPLVNTILMSVIENIRRGQFVDGSKLRNYAGGVTNNQINLYFRKRKQQIVKTLGELPEVSVEPAYAENLDRKERIAVLRAAMMNLADKYQQVLFLRYFEERTISEVSKIIKLPPRRVSERINYSLKLLKKELHKSPDFQYFETFSYHIEKNR